MTNVKAFYSEMTNSVHDRRVVDTVYLDFRQSGHWKVESELDQKLALLPD